MCVVDRIVIYEAMLWDFPSLATLPHTGERESCFNGCAAVVYKEAKNAVGGCLWVFF